jgi:hypothetical protein
VREEASEHFCGDRVDHVRSAQGDVILGPGARNEGLQSRHALELSRESHVQYFF